MTSELRQQLEKTREVYATVHTLDSRNFLMAVSDGMGGHACGEVASYLTVKYLSDCYPKLMNDFILGEQVFVNTIGDLNRAVVSAAQSDPNRRGMGATLCGVAGKDGMLYGFNVGDSRMYRYTNGTLEQLSTDHTEGQRLLNLRLLSPEECKNFPRRKNLYKFIGCSGDLAADVFRIGNCVPGTILLLCSDGVTDVITHDELSFVLSRQESIEEKGKMLIKEALKRNMGHGDNMTILLIEF